ncbi:hypothetical protein DM02DRAFT_482207, partial [Periconia macrospinosa]
AAVTQADFDKYMDRMERPEMTEEEIKDKLPEFLKSRVKAFSPAEANKLPPHRQGVDHAIVLADDSRVARPHIYGLTRMEAEAVKVYIDEMLGKGY